VVVRLGEGKETVEEHLADYLRDGWRITAVTAAAGGSPAYAYGWLAVVLEKGGA
jgi:hypothetical protein